MPTDGHDWQNTYFPRRHSLNLSVHLMHWFSVMPFSASPVLQENTQFFKQKCSAEHKSSQLLLLLFPTEKASGCIPFCLPGDLALYLGHSLQILWIKLCLPQTKQCHNGRIQCGQKVVYLIPLQFNLKTKEIERCLGKRRSQGYP